MSRDVWLDVVMDPPSLSLRVRDAGSDEEVVTVSCEYSLTWKPEAGDRSLDGLNIVGLEMRPPKLPAKAKKPRK